MNATGATAKSAHFAPKSAEAGRSVETSAGGDHYLPTTVLDDRSVLGPATRGSQGALRQRRGGRNRQNSHGSRFEGSTFRPHGELSPDKRRPPARVSEQAVPL